MKELSIEEKAQAYDEVLKKARMFYKDEHVDNEVNSLLEVLFPELKESEESEDEKMRKGIVKYLEQSQFGEEHYCVDDDIVRDYIAWLEKQGEHANFRNKIQVGDKVTRNEDGVLVNLSQLNRVAKKQGEQKPAKFDDTNAKRMFIKALECVEEQNAKGYKLTDCDKNSWWEDFKAYCSEQNLANSAKTCKDEQDAAWSEEDINMIDWLIRCCEKEHEELCNDRYGHQEIVSDLKRDCRKKWDWLESLKNRVAPQKQWKPSDEQLECLGYAIEKAE